MSNPIPIPTTHGTQHKPGGKRWRISRAVVTDWTSALPDDQRALLLWLFDYAASHNLSTDDLGARLKQPSGKTYSHDSVYQVMTGRRDKDALSRFLAAVHDLQKLEREREQITRAGFVETNLTNKVFQICDATRNFGKIGFIVGPSHTGKTTAVQEYTRRNNHGATYYVRMNSGGAKTYFLRRLAGVLNTSMSKNDYAVGEGLIRCFDNRMLLIVDEIHQCLYRSTGLATLEWLRELHDISGCGVLLVGTPVFAEALHARETAGVLRQLGMRKLIHCSLPDRPTKKNLAEFAKHFGLPPATGEALDLQTAVIAEDSLGRWISILEGASKVAAKAATPLAWTHVIKSHAYLQKLESAE